MLTGVYQSATILGVIVAFYVMDTWLLRRYDPLRQQGSSRSWSYTIMIMPVALLVVLQPVIWPGLGWHTDAWWGALLQALGLALIVGALALHGWARIHLGQFYGEREEVQEGQHLITTGPYAHMRHPLYTSYYLIVVGFLLVNPALPTLLALVYAFVDFSLATRREEKLLVEDLPGYADYMAHTPRFFPKLWEAQEADDYGA